MKIKIILALALAGIVPAGVRAQVTPNGRARTLDLRTAQSPNFDIACGVSYAGAVASKRWSSLPLSFEQTDDTSRRATYCDTLFASGFYDYGPNQEWQKCYDTLKKFIESCANYPQSYRAFNELAAAAESLNDPSDGVIIEFHQWLESVLYLNTTDPEYFCQCALLLVPPQAGDTSAQLLSLGANRSLSIYRWLLLNTTCDTAQLQRLYDGGRQNQITQHRLDSTYGNFFPLDTTLLPLDSMEPGLQELLEKHFLYADVNSEPNAPEVLSNASASPNPVNSETVISFTMNKEAYVRITLFDLLGKQLGASAFESFFQPGNKSVPISLAGLPSGTYYARIQTAYGEVQTVKLVKQ